MPRPGTFIPVEYFCRSRDSVAEMPSSPVTELLSLNLHWLREALQLVNRLEDGAFISSPSALPGQRAGSHFRHILEFYECFLDGREAGIINYSARRRDADVENSRHAAAARIRYIIRGLEEVAFHPHDGVMMRAESATDETWLPSSYLRELEALSSHTVHHFAMIAVILRLLGIAVDPDFGVSPSTLKFRGAGLYKAA
jgi:hypothetical protein